MPSDITQPTLDEVADFLAGYDMQNNPSGYATAWALINIARALDTPLPVELAEAPGSPCGSVRVLETWEGLERATVWCPRTGGGCPYVGTPQSRDQGSRPCAASEVADAH